MKLSLKRKKSDRSQGDSSRRLRARSQDRDPDTRPTAVDSSPLVLSSGVLSPFASQSRPLHTHIPRTRVSEVGGEEREIAPE